MKLIVYHGSDRIIEKPKHNGGRKFSDFGLGFYITTNMEMAKSWATRKKDKNAYVNKYMLNSEGLNSLTFELDLEWLLFIAFNRGLIKDKGIKRIMDQKYMHINKYDIIIGPTADDRMFDTLSLFFTNSITLEHCIQALNSMDLDIQYNIQSEKGILALEFRNVIELDSIDKEYYANEVKAKKEIMNNKMKFIRHKYGNIGKYFDELREVDLVGRENNGM